MEVRRMSDSLYHQGIKGQRWGVRRYQNEDGSLTPAGKDRYYKSERKQKLKDRRTLSDAELQSRLKRLRLEKDFKRESENDIYPGKQFCRDFLKKFGSTVLTSVATGATLYAINAAITKKWDADDAARYIAPPPKGKK